MGFFKMKGLTPSMRPSRGENHDQRGGMGWYRNVPQSKVPVCMVWDWNIMGSGRQGTLDAPCFSGLTSQVGKVGIVDDLIMMMTVIRP